MTERRTYDGAYFLQLFDADVYDVTMRHRDVGDELCLTELAARVGSTPAHTQESVTRLALRGVL